MPALTRSLDFKANPASLASGGCHGPQPRLLQPLRRRLLGLIPSWGVIVLRSQDGEDSEDQQGSGRPPHVSFHIS